MRFFSSVLVAVLSGALLVPSASARPAVGLTVNNSLVLFDTATPTTLTAGPTAITGIGAGETLLDIDLRPANGLLYGVSKDGSGVGYIYTINPTTVAATRVATLAADPADLTAPYTSLSGTEFGIDFNPVPDRLRVVSDTEQNLRINVANGLVTTDGELAFAAGDPNSGSNPNVTANAYTNSFAGSTATTLYGLDFASQSLIIQNPPNNGTLNTVGSLAPVPFTNVSGFDIASANGSNEGFAVLNFGVATDGSGLGSVNLSTGAVTPIGSGVIGGGAALRGLALLPLSQETPSLVVNSVSDVVDGFDGKTTLREAITFANSDPDNSAITFDLPAGPRAISLLSALPTLSTSLSIEGPTTNGVTVARSNASGTPNFRIFDVGAGTTVSLSNLTIANGRVVAPGGSATGAGIQNYGTLLTLNNCTVRDNFAGGNIGTNAGGGVLNGDNAPNSVGSRFVAINSTFSGNTVDCSSGAHYGAFGGGIYNSKGSMSLINCTLAANVATASNGSEAAGGGLYAFGSIALKNTLVASNIAPQYPNVLSSFSDGGGNFIDGNPRLGPLADNGGPTPTHALLPGSAAINAGVSSGAPATDQRGIARDSQPDSGAYEFVNATPSVTSVDPTSASDKVGAKRTFTLTVSDGNGAIDIKEAWLLINTRLNWAEGATLIYVPSESTPTNGLLYLRRGDSFLPPIQIGEGASAGAVLDNGAVRVVGNEVTVNLSEDGKGFTLSIPATIRDGLVGQNRLFTRVVDSLGATDAAALPGDNGYVRSGTYTVSPQFSGETNSAPTLSKLSPGAAYTTLNSSGIAPGVQTFVFYAKDENGLGDMESVWFMAGQQLNWAKSATFVYQPRTRRLFLRSDDGSTFLGGGQVGSAGIIENSKVRVDLSKVQVLIYTDGKSFGLRLPLQAKSGLLGLNKIWLRAQDKQGDVAAGSDAQGFVLSGTWNVTQGRSTTGFAAPSAGGS